MRNTTQFRDAGKYMSYLQTPFGKLRSDLAWENLSGFLPDLVHQRRVLDLGGGTGCVSLRLAAHEFQVVLLDSSEEMLAIARKETEATGVASRILFHHADAAQLHELFPPESFDVVVCHNMLEYVADADQIVRSIAHVMRKDALTSLLLRNHAGEVLKAAITSPDSDLAKENLSAKTVVDSLYGKPTRVFDSTETFQMLAHAGLQVVAEYGVRVFSDYRGSADQNAQTYRQLFELELILGKLPQFAAIARYTQTIASLSRPPLERRIENG